MTTALAIVAHPDDIEFVIAGTLLRLKDKGADIHMLNIASGSYGSMIHSEKDITRIRWEEAQASAREAGATMHPPLVKDLHIFYTVELLREVTAIVREVQPDIVLTHSPQDYMEDHMNAARLAVTAAFVRALPLVESDPPTAAFPGDTMVYHAMPHGGRDPLRKRIQAEIYVNITDVLQRKTSMLAKHDSQKAFLDAAQGMDSYLISMQDSCREFGRMSGRFEYAEGFRRHSHLGFASHDGDPLSDALGDLAWTDPAYIESLG
ncbi:MAG: PIG-L family deacetylase [Burkholderiales bacterium]|nr:PIG-L family deacetylase [Anaerolineae bacterium]